MDDHADRQIRCPYARSSRRYKWQFAKQMQDLLATYLTLSYEYFLEGSCKSHLTQNSLSVVTKSFATSKRPGFYINHTYPENGAYINITHTHQQSEHNQSGTVTPPPIMRIRSLFKRSDHTGLEGRMAKLERKVDELDEIFKHLEGRVQASEQKIVGLRVEANVAEEQASALQSKSDNQRPRLRLLETNAKATGSRMDRLSSDMQNLLHRVARLESQVA